MKYMYLQYGKTPLHKASVESHISIVHLLLEKGANINAVDNVSYTTLYDYQLI